MEFNFSAYTANDLVIEMSHFLNHPYSMTRQLFYGTSFVNAARKLFDNLKDENAITTEEYSMYYDELSDIIFNNRLFWEVKDFIKERKEEIYDYFS